MNLKGVRTLVTGGTGFLGGRLIEKLVLDYHADVNALVRQFSHASRLARFPVRMYAGGIEDYSAVDRSAEGCSLIFHCAYDFASPFEGEKNINIIGAQNIAKAAIKHKARLIHVSTVDVYGWPHVEVLQETSERLRPPNLYGRVKNQIEKIMIGALQTESLAVTILQPAVVYGPFAGWTLTPVQRLREKNLLLVDGGEGACNPVYIDDVVQALLLASQEPKAIAETFLISGNQPVTWREFISFYEAMLGTSGTIPVNSKNIEDGWNEKAKESHAFRLIFRLLRDPRTRAKLQSIPAINRVVRLFNRPDDHVESSNELQPSAPAPPMLLEELPLYCTRAKISIEKARRILGFEPKFDLQRGMDLTAQFLRWANIV